MIMRVRRVLWWVGVPVRTALIGAIRVYQVTLTGVLGGQCRFHPTCSHYAEHAIRHTGAVRGSALAAWRVLRCSPLTSGGIDHPPEPPAWRRDIQTYDAVIPPRRDSGPLVRRVS